MRITAELVAETMMEIHWDNPPEQRVFIAGLAATDVRMGGCIGFEIWAEALVRRCSPPLVVVHP